MDPVPPISTIEHTAFKAAMIWRIGYGVLRLYIGYRLLSLIGLPVADAYEHMMRRVLNGAHDEVFMFISHVLARHGYSITYFLAIHFLFWGVIDIVLSYAMIRHHLWSFIISIYVIAIFLVYEIYRFTHTHSHLLLAFILMDAFFIYLIKREYEKVKVLKERND